MYMTIGIWIETLTRQTWESFVGHRILSPLEMTATNFTIADMQASADFARPYAGANALEFRDIRSVGPAGSINSNVLDLTKWLSFQLRRGKTAAGVPLISEPQHERLFKKESDASALLPGGQSIGYGLGWFLSDINGHRVIWHGGNIDGFSSFVSFVPDSDLAVIILTNENNGSAFEFPITLPATAAHPDIELLPLTIYNELLPGGQTRSAAARFAMRTTLPWVDLHHPLFRGFEHQLSVRQTLRPLNVATPEDFTGAFSEAAYGDVTVSSTPAGLAFDTFKVSFPVDAVTTDIPVVFRRDSQGTVTGLAMPLEPSVDDIFFARAGR
jgi:hypothetical protein